jgi:hypothetical protein
MRNSVVRRGTAALHVKKRRYAHLPKETSIWFAMGVGTADSARCKKGARRRIADMFNRKTAPKVRDGRVQKKNRHAPTRLNSLGIGLERPRSGFRHVASRQDVWKFIRLLPDWKRLSTDLDVIYLADGDHDYDGWYEYPQHPSIALAAWPEDLIMRPLSGYYSEHRAIFQSLGVPCESTTESDVLCHFTEDSARAYQLTHIFLHELGHHHYRITEGKGRSAGTEKYAEDYAIRWHRRIWKSYCLQFRFRPPLPPKEESPLQE